MICCTREGRGTVLTTTARKRTTSSQYCWRKSTTNPPATRIILAPPNLSSPILPQPALLTFYRTRSPEDIVHFNVHKGNVLRKRKMVPASGTDRHLPGDMNYMDSRLKWLASGFKILNRIRSIAKWTPVCRRGVRGGLSKNSTKETQAPNSFRQVWVLQGVSSCVSLKLGLKLLVPHCIHFTFNSNIYNFEWSNVNDMDSALEPFGNWMAPNGGTHTFRVRFQHDFVSPLRYRENASKAVVCKEFDLFFSYRMTRFFLYFKTNFCLGIT